MVPLSTESRASITGPLSAAGFNFPDVRVLKLLSNYILSGRKGQESNKTTHYDIRVTRKGNY